MKAFIGAVLGAAVPLAFIATSWLTPEQHEAVGAFINAAMPYVIVLAFAIMGASIAGAASDDGDASDHRSK